MNCFALESAINSNYVTFQSTLVLGFMMLCKILQFLDPRSDSMKGAYDGELQSVLVEIESTRSKMEGWYALRLEDEHVVGDQYSMYETIMAQFDSMITKINGSTKLVKNAIVTSLQNKSKQLYMFNVLVKTV